MTFNEWWRKNSVDLHDSYSKGDMEWIAELAWKAAVIMEKEGSTGTITRLVDTITLAYRKHHLGDESIGWDELGECLLNTLCDVLGDDGYQQWLESIGRGRNDKSI
uniref:Uncharacterized protein n=1 Tax=viral metagenome TaxID=1070528 RepID=A0A6M3KVA8_9ZZZZ